MRYITPSGTILDKPEHTAANKIESADSIAAFLDGVGVPCTGAGQYIAPQLITYMFNIEDYNRESKINKAVKCLSMYEHANCAAVSTKEADFAIAVPRKDRQMLRLYDVINTDEFADAPHDDLTCTLGVDDKGAPVIYGIEKAPHMLIAGATGSGKSVLLNSIIASLMFKFPYSLKFVMIDPKKVEMSMYEGIPHLLRPIAKSCTDAIQYLNDLCQIMDDRYTMMSKAGVKNINELKGQYQIVIVIDELADLMLTSKYEAETSIIRLAQLGRAAGIHLIIATQRPTVNVVTGLIKGNIPCKIALQTASIRDSMNILDHKGAETLTGKGDALLKRPDKVEEIRFQSPYVTDEELERITSWWKTEGQGYIIDSNSTDKEEPVRDRKRSPLPEKEHKDSKILKWIKDQW